MAAPFWPPVRRPRPPTVLLPNRPCLADSEERERIQVVDGDEAAAAIGLTVGASGKASVRTVTLLTPEQVDAAAKRTPTYRAPGA